MARIFTGDYSTGNLSQFDAVQNKFVNKGGGDYHTQGAAGQYPVQVVAGTCGYAARFEVRPGDIAAGVNERSEVRATSSSARVAVGGTAWYAFSMKFDKTWPTNQTSLGWLVVGQFGYFPDMPSSPVISFGNGMTGGPGTRDGYFYLVQNPQTPKPGGGYTYVSPHVLAIAEFPLNVGQWHDFKMQAKWATDNTGFINLWHNGSRVTFTADGGGGQTFNGQTALASGQGAGESVTHVCVSHGIYRQPNVSPTGVMHYTGLRIADTETSL